MRSSRGRERMLGKSGHIEGTGAMIETIERIGQQPSYQMGKGPSLIYIP